MTTPGEGFQFHVGPGPIPCHFRSMMRGARTRSQTQDTPGVQGQRGAGKTQRADADPGKVLVIFARGGEESVPTIDHLCIPRGEYLNFLRIWNETKHTPFHDNDGDEEQVVGEPVIHRHRDSPAMFSMGPYPGFYYKASAFRDIPSFGFGLNVTGCELGDETKFFVGRPRQSKSMKITGVITVVSTVDEHGEFE